MLAIAVIIGYMIATCSSTAVNVFEYYLCIQKRILNTFFINIFVKF